MSQQNICVFQYFNASSWNVSKEEIAKYISLADTEKEKTRISKFFHDADKKRAVAGHLLTRLTIAKILNLPLDSIRFDRTHENKPFLKIVPSNSSPQISASISNSESNVNNTTASTTSTSSEASSSSLPKYISFNITHSGDYVCIGIIESFSDNIKECQVVGVDVEQIKPVHVSQIRDYISSFEQCFTAREWNNQILNEEGVLNTSVELAHEQDRKLLERMLIHWTLKESFIKAIGLGVGFELQRVEFRFEQPQSTCSTTTAASNDSVSYFNLTPVVYIDGKKRENWRFKLFKTPDGTHISSIALGYLQDEFMAPTYISSLMQNKIQPSALSSSPSATTDSPLLSSMVSPVKRSVDSVFNGIPCPMDDVFQQIPSFPCL